jgi:hypothetical protein
VGNSEVELRLVYPHSCYSCDVDRGNMTQEQTR